jgi:hypothetical protein
MRDIALVMLLLLCACGSAPTPARGAGLGSCDHLVDEDGHLHMVRCCSDAGC